MEAPEKMMEEKAPKPAEAQKESATFICSRDTLDGVYPPLLLAINARRQGMDASVFFTFMGLNAIRKGWIKKIKFQPPGFLGAIPGMSSMATGMMKKKIENAGIPEIEDMMELRPEDFIEDVEIWTAEEYMKHARSCKINMFI